MTQSMHAGDLLAGRYRLEDLLTSNEGGRFWRAHDLVLERPVAVHLIPADDPRAEELLTAARRSARVVEPRILRVLDADEDDHVCYVVNEWGAGTSLDKMFSSLGPMAPRPAAWLVSEVAGAVANAHAAGVTHGRLVPENVLVDPTGGVHLIGTCVEAALHGLPAGSEQDDVRELAALLHACLTGTWPGSGDSDVQPTPVEHGRTLRPRQVRPGVPRVLDDLCHELLSTPHRAPKEDHGTARAFAAVLDDFVGDPTGLGEAIAAGTAVPMEQVDLPRVKDPKAPEDPLDEPTQLQDAVADDEDTRTGVPDHDQPTQAGMPTWDDSEDHPHVQDSDWSRPRRDPVPPPPPLQDPPPKPLFAEEAAGGGHGRSHRTDHAAGGHRAGSDDTPTGQIPMTGEYWPWNPSSTSSGALPVYDERAGRTWLRLAGAVAVVLLLITAVAVAYNLGRGRGPLGGSPDPTETAEPTGEPTPFSNTTVTDFDPLGSDGGVENSEEAPLANDGDPATDWYTSEYFQQFPALKAGVGLLVDLGRVRSVREVDVTLGEGDQRAELYVLPSAPQDPVERDPDAEVTGGGEQQVTLQEPVEGQYVLLWFTELVPQANGNYRGNVYEIEVLG